MNTLGTGAFLALQRCGRRHSYTALTVELSEKQRKQTNAIASLVTQPDRSSVTQAIELAAALDDQMVFAELLDGLAPGERRPSRFPNHRRYPMVVRAAIFDQMTGSQAWLDLAMIHLVAVSDLPVRSQIRSVALGTQIKKYASPAPTLWLEGLENLTALTHLDLHLGAGDDGLDLQILEQFPSLTHLRIRGRGRPGPLPSMPHLEVLDGIKLQLDEGTTFPALRSITGKITIDAPITPEMMPELVEVRARDGVHLAGFDSLAILACSKGDVVVNGCVRIDHLSVAVDRFDAPDLRHVGLLERASPGVDVTQLDSLGELKLNRRSKFVGGTFPDGTQLADPQVVLWGPAVSSLGNIGELPGLEVLLMSRVTSPVSLDTLRHATDLRVLDIRHSPGISDLSPLFALPNLEVLVLTDADRFEMPDELRARVQRVWRKYPLPGAARSVPTKKA